MKSLPRLCSLSLMTFFFAPALGLSTVHAGEALQDRDKVAVCGDSITEQKMYSVLIEDYLLMCQPASHLAAHQFGWGGETAPGFFARMKNDAMLFHPTVATTCYGMNDGGYVETKPDRVDKYKQGLEDIIKTFKDGGVRFIVVGSPGIVDPESFKNAHFIHASGETYNKTLGDFSNVAKAVATENGVAFADVHGAMVSALAKSKTVYGPNFIFTAMDGIHPQMLGHVVMAYAFLKGLGCTGDIGTITVDMTSNQTEVDAAQKVVSSNNGTIQLVSSRYPFCFANDPDPRSARAALPLIPFNEELNRYMLVVKNLNGTKAKVTWGTNTKEFSTADLAKGINLAAEFPDNPFSDHFKAVEEAIKKQQNYETPAVKSALHAIPDLSLILPEKKDVIQSLRDTVIQKSNDLSTAAQQAVTPVQHTITITPES